MLPTVMPSLIARFTRRRQRPLRALEPADMGTAFGMEQWLDERDHGGVPGMVPTPTPAPLAPPAAAPRRTWLSRWLRVAVPRRAGT